jgi:hypothetical protein
MRTATTSPANRKFLPGSRPAPSIRGAPTCRGRRDQSAWGGVARGADRGGDVRTAAGIPRHADLRRGRRKSALPGATRPNAHRRRIGRRGSEASRSRAIPGLRCGRLDSKRLVERRCSRSTGAAASPISAAPRLYASRRAQLRAAANDDAAARRGGEQRRSGASATNFNFVPGSRPAPSIRGAPTCRGRRDQSAWGGVARGADRGGDARTAAGIPRRADLRRGRRKSPTSTARRPSAHPGTNFEFVALFEGESDAARRRVGVVRFLDSAAAAWIQNGSWSAAAPVRREQRPRRSPPRLVSTPLVARNCARRRTTMPLLAAAASSGAPGLVRRTSTSFRVRDRRRRSVERRLVAAAATSRRGAGSRAARIAAATLELPRASRATPTCAAAGASRRSPARRGRTHFDGGAAFTHPGTSLGFVVLARAGSRAVRASAD